jgi:flagellar protein FliL
MAEEESLEVDESNAPKSKKKLFMFAGAGLLLLILIGVGVWMLMGSDESAPAADAESSQEQAPTAKKKTGEAFYVAMPRPFLFNLPGVNRARLVEIKVQLMVRGAEDDNLIKKHIPLIEDALLTAFSGADVQKLSTQAGKDELRQLALLNVQNTVQPIVGRKVVEKVLFTGFVMQ